MASPPPPLGEQYFYFVSTPCPEVIEPCTGEYTSDVTQPPPVDPDAPAIPTRTVVGEVRCAKDKSFSLENVRGKVGLFNPSNPEPLVTFTSTNDHYVTIRCKPPFACAAEQFGNSFSALRSLRALACPQITVSGDNGEIVRMQLRGPVTQFSVIAADRSDDVLMGGLGIGVSVRVPRSWYVPLHGGVLLEWLTGSPRSVTGEEATVDLHRFGVYGEVGVAVSLELLRRWVGGTSGTPLWANVEVGGAYRFGYDHLKGTYRFPNSVPFSVDDGGFNHYPAVWVSMSGTLGSPTVSDVGLGFDESWAGLARGDRGGIADTVNHHTPFASVGLGTYTTELKGAPRTLTAPAPHYPLSDLRSSATRRLAQEGVAVELLPTSLEDAWGHVHTTTLAFDADGNLKGNLEHELSTLMTEVSDAFTRRPHAAHLFIHYAAYTNSIDTEAYNNTLSQQWADASRQAIDTLLRADTNFGWLMKGDHVTTASVGRGESKPVDLEGHIIDADRCEEESVSDDKVTVIHPCGSSLKIQEHLHKSRRLVVTMQAEKDDIAVRLHGLGAQRSALESSQRMLPGHVIAFSLDLSEHESALFANFSLLRNRPQRRFVSVIVSGKNPMETDGLVERLLPAIRSARPVDIEILRTKAPLAGTARAYVLAHPDQRIDLRQTLEPTVRDMLEVLAQ